ncbi:Transglycosylase-associated protein [Oxalobacteraceae bacterium IMCC9480]|nr:Transglycosylase-associated protein [Oxalobacteraceae bacterium IMCC9480]NDP59066.1 GlsB/YeaQ/YmgE family stress response membrane protein [Oxalobacteraceae bacterium]
MNFIIWIVIGGVLGWLTSIIMKTNAQQGTLLNVVVGIVGAMTGGWLLAPLLGTRNLNQNDFSISALLVALLVALASLAVIHLLWREKT